MKIAIVYS